MSKFQAAGPLCRTLLVAVGLAGVWGTGAAQMQSREAQPETLPFEVTAFGGYTWGGSFKVVGDGGSLTNESMQSRAAFAAAFDYRLEDTRQYELFYSRESSHFGGNGTFPQTDMTVQYIHVGGTVLLTDEKGLSPYIAGGIGATVLDPGGSAGGSAAKFSASLAMGVRWTFNQRFAVRVEARGFGTLMNPQTQLFCRSDQAGAACLIQSRSSGFFQGQALAGAVFAF
jgi:hypothetical protein